MRHNKHAFDIVFYSYDETEDKTTFTNGTTTEIFTGRDTWQLLKLFKAIANITNNVNLIRY